MIIETIKSVIPQTFRGHAPIGTKCPYVVYNENHPNIGADDKVYVKTSNITAQLYLLAPDSISDTLEDALSGAGIFWTSEEADDPDQGVYSIIFNMEEISS